MQMSCYGVDRVWIRCAYGVAPWGPARVACLGASSIQIASRFDGQQWWSALTDEPYSVAGHFLVGVLPSAIVRLAGYGWRRAFHDRNAMSQANYIPDEPMSVDVE